MRRKFPGFTIIVFGLCIIIGIIGVKIWLANRWGKPLTYYYFVQEGETIQSIAKKNSVSVEKILLINKIPNPDKLYANQPLLIPVSNNVDPATLNLFNEYCHFPDEVKRRHWKYIIIHHSATVSGNAREFNEYHLKTRKWKNGLGYDFVIGSGKGSLDGVIEVGQRWAKQMAGSHTLASNMNENGIGICLVGNFEMKKPTDKQMETTLELVRYLRKRYGIPLRNVLGHGEVKGSSTDCPGKNMNMDKFRESL
jgi:LysM repeat protein